MTGSWMTGATSSVEEGSFGPRARGPSCSSLQSGIVGRPVFDADLRFFKSSTSSNRPRSGMDGGGGVGRSGFAVGADAGGSRGLLCGASTFSRCCSTLGVGSESSFGIEEGRKSRLTRFQCHHPSPDAALRHTPRAVPGLKRRRLIKLGVDPTTLLRISS